jgi:cytochrome c-type biogenesis protein CcmE
MGRMKFMIGGLLILGAVASLIFVTTRNNMQEFMTVDELKARGAAATGQNLTVSGAIIGDTIQYDPQTLKLTFTIAQVPGSMNEVTAEGGLAAVLHAAVIDPSRARLPVSYTGPKPDLLKNEAQAIVTGHLDADGVFQADQLLLKCPTRYNDAVPNQAGG